MNTVRWKASSEARVFPRPRAPRRVAAVATGAIIAILLGAPDAAAQQGTEPTAPEAADDGIPDGAESYWALSIDDAIRMGLDAEQGLRIARLDRQRAGESVDAAEGAFDVRLGAQGTLTRSRSPFFSSSPFSGLPPGLNAADSNFLSLEGSVEKLFILGTTGRITVSSTRQRTENSFALNPAYEPVIRVDVTQPVLQGFGPSVNGAEIDRAEIGILQADEEQNRQAMETTLRVVEAYWNYVFALEDLELKRQSLSVAIDLLDVNRRKLEQGSIAEIEVLVAETGVATRREAIIGARNAVLDARDALLALVQPGSRSATWDVRVIPTDRPRDVHVAVDPETSFARAERYRPELRTLALTRRIREIDLLVAEDALLPRVDVIGSASWSGLGNSPDNSWDALGTGDYYELSLGFSFEWPVPNRTARAQARLARLDIARQDLAGEQTLTGILVEVRAAVRNVLASEERIRAAEQTTRLAERQLEAERTKFEVGVSTNHAVLEFEEDLNTARTAELRARVDLELSRARLYRAEGTILDAYDVEPALSPR